ncbi:hypothetical protein A6723_009195 [Pseudomonas sp. AU11447]|nr:hypothetical protein A6723_009195 [Pseudomonas sp. AU11447]
MNNSFQHFFFTNFGIGIKDEIWLSYRLEIFVNTVFPSLANQSSRDFEWVIFIDKALPVIHVRRLQSAIQTQGLNARLLPVDEYIAVPGEIEKLLADVQSDTLLTSRIDDDDCIHHRVVELIQREALGSSSTEDIQVISLKKGFEFLPSDSCYREVSHQTLALALTLVDRTQGGKKRSINQYAHHLVVDTLAKQGVRFSHTALELDVPLYLYTKHPLSDSYFFGSRARIIADPKRRDGFDETFFSQYGLSSQTLAYLTELTRHAPLGMPHKYLEKLSVVRAEIRAESARDNRGSDSEMDVLLARKNRFERHAVRSNPSRREGGKIRVAVLGSCVTRDLFEVQRQQLEPFELCYYMARSSVISYMGQPCVDARIKVPDGGFEDRRAQWDLSKQHWDLLEQSRPDIILLDFIDERIGLIQHQGSVFSASGPVIKAFERSSTGFDIRRPWSREIQALRQWALPKFLDRVYSICQNIIVHKATWATHFKSVEGDLQSFAGSEFEKLIELNNDVLDGMYEQLENTFAPVELIGGAEAGLVAGGNYRWSFSPYHYDSSYYKTLARQLRARVIY